LAWLRPEFGFTGYGGGQICSLIDRKTALGLAGMFACAWLVTFLVQLKNVFSLR
jgi:hypothetical protein